MDYYATGSGN